MVSKIVKELAGGKYASDQIRGIFYILKKINALSITFYKDGCRIYRKTLHEADKEKTASQKKKMRIRSRQQRVC